MRTILPILLLGAFAFALVAPIPILDIQKDGVNTVNILIDSEISADNMESAEYTIPLSNPGNETSYFTLRISFNYKPESLSLERGGKKVELAAETEQARYASYVERIGLEPNENVTYTLKYRALRTPYEYGIWALKYSYNIPISLEASTGRDYVPILSRYSGEIRPAYAPDKVSCAGCTQKGGKIALDNSQFFGASWDKRRTPYRAGIFYVLMLSGIALSIARARRVTPAKKLKGSR